MRWGFPTSLLLLLFAVPLILWLHSLRPKGLTVKTTTLFLWERILRERPVGARLGRLFRKNLLLILQILIAAVLIAALADPSLLRYGAASGDIVAVVDLSASMKARGRFGARFDEARNEFLSLVDALSSGQKMMVIGAGPMARVLAPFTTDKKRLRELGRNLKPTDTPARVKEAVLFGHSFLRRGSHDRVIVLSDGAFEGAEELPWHSSYLQLVKVSGGEVNVGITGFELRRLPDDPRRSEFMVTVKNFGPRPAHVPVTLRLKERDWIQDKVEVAPQQSRVLIYPYAGPATGRATVSLAVQDDFPTDNQAYLALAESSAPIRLLYVGKGNPFLEHLFRFLPYVQVTRLERLDPEASASQLPRYDLTLLDGVPSPPLTEGNFLLINTVAEGLPLKVKGKIPTPRPLPALAGHPVTQGVRLDDLYIREALHLIPAGGVTLAHSKEGPLIIAFDKGKLRAVVIGFDLLATDLPYRVAFPVLFSNALDWFHPRGVEFPSAKVQAGIPYALHLQGSDEQVEVIGPSGSRERLPAGSNPFRFAETFEVGFYSFRTKSGEGEFAVNLLSESESQISPRVPARAQDKTRTRGGDSGGREKTGFALWPLLLAAALALLLAEGFLVFRHGAALYPLLSRLLAVAGVFLAMVNPRFFTATDALDVVLSVDYSRSVGQEGKHKALQVLEETPRIQGSKTRTGLLFFGSQAAWEFFPREDFGAADFSPSVGRDQTDLQAALQAALAQLGEGRQGRILLISDGNQNRGEVSTVLPVIRSHGAQVWTLPVSLSRGRNEVYLKELVLPRSVDSAEGFEVKAAIESLQESSGRVKLLRNGVVQREQEVALTPGTSWVSFKESLRDRGTHTFELLIEPADDTLPENNLLQGVVQVKGPPRVLYLYSQQLSRPFLSRILALQGYSVVEAAPEQRALSLPELAGFDLLVLDNVAAYRLTQTKMEAVERYVRDLGGGLMVIGGPQSYGAGGYYKTPLERLLPVEMRPPSRLNLPHVALLFVLDKSGSMGAGPQGATKLDLAKAAAAAAADLLNPADQVGILAFDAAWEWILPFRPVGKGELISERLAALQSDGGTDLYKALVEARRAFGARTAAIKHLLVLSDGLTDKMDFHSLVSAMTREGITVSAVALGQDADLALMSEVARVGKGRGYVTVDPKTVPQIFTTETLLISRDLLVEQLTYPKVTATGGPLKGFSRKVLPPVRGYVLTHPKAHAELMIKAGEDPLLASWRYGLGKVVAFTSDLSGRWGKEWVAWDDFPQWGSQLARYAMRRISDQKIQAALRQEGEEILAVVDLFSPAGGFRNHLRLKGNLAGPERVTLEREFKQIAPGRYEASFSASRRGVYLMTISEEGKEGEIASTVTTVPFVAPYPGEYRELKLNTGLLSRLAEETGGELLDPDRMEEGLKRLFTPDPDKGQSARETWWSFSALGLFLFLADLALRRLPLLVLQGSRPGI